MHLVAESAPSVPVVRGYGGEIRGALEQMARQAATGVLFVTSQAGVDRVRFSDGRAIWVHTEACDGSLRARLQATSGLTDAQLQDTLAACRRDKRGLGEYLVEHGLLSRWRLREVLLSHNRSHMAALLAAAEVYDECPTFGFEPRHNVSDPALTFTIQSLLARGAERLSPVCATVAVAEACRDDTGCDVWVLQWGVVLAQSSPQDPPAGAQTLLANWRSATSGLNVGLDSVSNLAAGSAELIAMMGRKTLLAITAPDGISVLVLSDSGALGRPFALGRRLRATLVQARDACPSAAAPS